MVIYQNNEEFATIAAWDFQFYLFTLVLGCLKNINLKKLSILQKMSNTTRDNT